MNYVWTNHPITGERIAVIPTGKKDGDQAEFRAITARCNIDTLWLRRSDLLAE
jgi:hypothetical protein